MNPNEESALGKTWHVWLKLLAVLAVVGASAGSMSALFLWSLNAVTVLHFRHPWLLLLLPVAGMVVAWFYNRYGTLAARGSHLLVEEIHEWKGKVPLRMAPLVLGGTLITHLFGGSAGREGTAVQMGGAVAAWLSRVFSLDKGAQRMVLMGGIAAGFGAVFGTPWAGAAFAVELPVRGRWQMRMVLPMLIASWIGHMTCLAWGIHHSDFRQMGLSEEGLMPVSTSLLMNVAMAAVAFGLCARLFVFLSHNATAFFARVSPEPLWCPFLGGGLIIVLVFSLGTADYLGLGVHAVREGGVSMLSSFSPGGADAWSWFWKLAFTVVTLSSGFNPKSEV
jgi:H+/Cl- antiporter ClcA